MQSSEFMIGMLGAISFLILVWIITIHLRVNNLRKEIEKLEKLAKD